MKSSRADINQRRIRRAWMYYQHKGGQPKFDNVPPGRERIELVLGGRGWLRCNGQLEEVTPGHILWHVAGDETICQNDESNPYSCLSLHVECYPRSKKRLAPRIAHWDNIESAQDFSEQVIRWHFDTSVDREALTYFALGSLLVHARRKFGTGNHQYLPRKTRQLIRALESNYRYPKPLREIARQAGCSLAHLHATIKEQTGQTPHAIVQARRLSAAKELLVSTDKQIKEIAMDCGFSNAAAFCHTFKLHTGETPMSFRYAQTGVR